MKNYNVTHTVDIGSTSMLLTVRASSPEKAQEKARAHVAALFTQMIQDSELSNHGVELDDVLMVDCELTDSEPDLV